MQITVNGQAQTMEKEISVKELLAAQQVEMPEYVTVQVNEELVVKENFATTIVKDGDVVEFLYFMGGGAL